MTSMTTYINGTLNYCGKSSMPACSGSNVSAGLYNAVAQLMTAGIAGPQSNIVIITDGVPNADDISYTASMGTETPPLIAGTTYSTAVRNAQVTTPVCASTKGVCTDANLLTATHNQVAFANALGINISTIYYTGDTASGSVASYETELASWVTGKGTAIIAPTAASINTNFAQFCSSMGSAAKSVSVIH
jgi:hypothetical protein